MKNLKDFAGETVEFVVPAAKNAGEYVCFIGKKVKDGFGENKAKITKYLSKKDNKDRVLKWLCTILLILSLISLALEICDLVKIIKKKKSQKELEN